MKRKEFAQAVLELLTKNGETATLSQDITFPEHYDIDIDSTALGGLVLGQIEALASDAFIGWCIRFKPGARNLQIFF